MAIDKYIPNYVQKKYLTLFYIFNYPNKLRKKHFTFLQKCSNWHELEMDCLTNKMTNNTMSIAIRAVPKINYHLFAINN